MQTHVHGLAEESYATMLCHTTYIHALIPGLSHRFLQGQDTDEQAVKDIRHAIQEASETTVRLLNYKKSGKAFWNMFTLAPMADVDGTARFLIGVQVDVTAVEEALPDSLKATNAGPQVPKGAANAITAGQSYTSCCAAGDLQFIAPVNIVHRPLMHGLSLLAYMIFCTIASGSPTCRNAIPFVVYWSVCYPVSLYVGFIELPCAMPDATQFVASSSLWQPLSEAGCPHLTCTISVIINVIMLICIRPVCMHSRRCPTFAHKPCYSAL